MDNDNENYIPRWALLKRSNTPPISVDPLRLNLSKINQAFRKQDLLKELQKYNCIIQDFEEFKILSKKDYVTFFVSFFSYLVSDKHIRSNIKQLFKKFNEKNGPESFMSHLHHNFSPIVQESEINKNIFNIQAPNIPNMNNAQPDRNSSILTNFEYEPQNRNSYLYTKTSNANLYVQVSPIPENKQTAFYKLFLFYGLNSAPFKSSFFVNFEPSENPDKIILYNIKKTNPLSQKLIMSSSSTTQQVKERIIEFMKNILEMIYILHLFGIIIGNLDCSNIRYFYKKPNLYSFLIDSFSYSSYFPDFDKFPVKEFNKKLLESFKIIANILINKIYKPV
jgi:hypothetical protein